MFSFSTTAALHHVTPLPSATTIQTALTILHNHDLLIRLDPELSHYETLPPLPSAPNTKRYKITDTVHALPAGLWDSRVTFESEITDMDDGAEWLIKAPLGLVQKTTWRIIRAETLAEEERGQGEWCLVEDMEIKGNRMVVGFVKAKCEEGWRGVHGRFLAHLEKS
ncbi:hypothetical protein P153DRAFT_359993 [Dothidotthia symphoricarpi CBS 119687]|uniref:DUF7053 domain-containing protein n=1 Tax=Dothidotthia symphoricarpi CBS 119687 TaxID=1392245 RepID=A0A6A6A3F7_9PLEO|nr:uncharacterized protein P153DRAFT_359993 [Dothidotthia symphoricarpi CBS 119687]KAF2125644.1 hypothetical protein P153DRAFT_359993 [Dothidotthia symphoricarpi CBS 119687]